jgi:ComF family protein
VEPAFLKGLCTPAGRALAALLGGGCLRCGARVESAWLGALCRPCRAALPWEKGGASASRYEGAMRDAVHAWKFRGRRSLTRAFAAAMAEGARGLGAGAVACVPPSGASLREKGGFDHAGELGRALARRLGLPFLKGSLARREGAIPQKKLKRGARLRAMQGAFEARLPRRFEGARVLLVDDVSTTGATLKDASRALAWSGAGEVLPYTLARTPKWR